MNIKEASHIFIVLLLFAFVISFLQGIEAFLYALIIAFTVIAINLAGKYALASHIDAEIETKIWQIQRYGYYERSHFKTPVPAGIIIPFILTILSWGFVNCLSFLQTDVKKTPARVAKRTGGLVRFSDITEWHFSAVPAAGIAFNLLASLLIFIFAGNSFVLSMGKISAFYAIWNLIPIGQLDGSKIFFGSRYLWLLLVILSAVFTLIALVI